MDYLKILKDSGFTNKKIGDKLGIGERTVSAYFKGHRQIPESTKRLIEYEFGIKQVGEPPQEYQTAKDSIEELQQRLLDKDEMIQSQRDHIQSLKEQIDLLKFQLDQRKTAN